MSKKLTAESLVASAWAAALATTITDDVPPGWHTLREIAVKLGKAESTVGAQLGRAVREGRAEALMKGSLHTDELMAEVVSRETGLRTARRTSHVFVMKVPA